MNGNVCLDQMTDEQLVLLSNQGNTLATDYLMHKFRSVVRQRARTYFLVGADREDIIQEGMIGLFKAVRDFDPSRRVTFKSFAEMCITRQIITAIKTATRQKHAPLNSYISLNRPLFDDEYDSTLLDSITDDEKTTNPEVILLNRERYAGIGVKIESLLSKFECKVLNEYLKGSSYQQISARLDTRPKSVDNAMQRIKRKLESLL